MSDSSWSFYFESQYDDDTLNDTEEVGKVLVTNVTTYISFQALKR